MTSENPFTLLLPVSMAKIAENIGVYKVNKHPLKTFYSAITAGVFISIAFVFFITVMMGTDSMPLGIARLIGGICFSLGLILVLVSGADLFTSSVLIVMAKASHRITWKQLSLNWLNVYCGNFIGAIFFVGLIWAAQQHLFAESQWGLQLLNAARHKLNNGFIAAMSLGILANLMVCLAVWMSYSGRTLLDKMSVMILPVAMFVACGFEHSIANMFLIPMAIVVKEFASASFWQSAQTSADQFAELTFHNFIFDNLIPVTIGNIIGGGLLVGLTYWAIYLRED